MKFVIGLIIVVGLSLGAYQFYQYWGTYRDRDPDARVTAPAPAQVEVSGDQLPGLPQGMQGQLQSAEQHGLTGLKEFLAVHGKDIKDPRKAWIELDYVVLAGASDPGEARRVFAKVKARVQSDSPVYKRVKQLEKTYE